MAKGEPHRNTSPLYTSEDATMTKTNITHHFIGLPLLSMSEWWGKERVANTNKKRKYVMLTYYII